ncbi:hypothetical protein [Cryobacterium zhongshanensis]|nr:hypothetical protein [Cryobacterium zhongshanensis]
MDPSADMRPPRNPQPAPIPPAPIVDVWNVNPETNDPDNPTPF